ncbi:receptor-like protein 12 [Pyrus ussuriensis x Pyrus communis]|uniref:Receptor-like protein 12 n=1 Tax=Pyrus ussuriensis x Pyrus communis TaxID=2448454 RepID=A0A5N5H8U4_9ROSA|nr:receptor-like protein 12 [Pyrus ussuriensis x Pyrus communis]
MLPNDDGISPVKVFLDKLRICNDSKSPISLGTCLLKLLHEKSIKVINVVKSELEDVCLGVVSCGGILAMAMGGPS